MLKEAEIDFAIWNSEGEFNSEEMNTILAKIFNDFQGRYAEFQLLKNS